MTRPTDMAQHQPVRYMPRIGVRVCVCVCGVGAVRCVAGAVAAAQQQQHRQQQQRQRHHAAECSSCRRHHRPTYAPPPRPVAAGPPGPMPRRGRTAVRLSPVCLSCDKKAGSGGFTRVQASFSPISHHTTTAALAPATPAHHTLLRPPLRALLRWVLQCNTPSDRAANLCPNRPPWHPSTVPILL